MATDKSLGMKTTSGAYALQNATANHDAFIVEKAREAGMVVIGKANLGVCVRGSSTLLTLVCSPFRQELNGFKYAGPDTDIMVGIVANH